MPRSTNVMPWSKTRRLGRMRQGLPAILQPVLALVPTRILRLGPQGSRLELTRCGHCPGHGTGQPAGPVTEGAVGAHPIGINTRTGRTTAHNTLVGGNAPNYGTGGTYN